MPEPTRDEMIVEAFWSAETFWGYEVALKYTAEKFGVSCEEVERLTIEDDELNNGNFTP